MGIKNDRDKRYPQLIEAVLATGEIEVKKVKTKGASKNCLHPVHKALPIYRPEGDWQNKPLISPNFATLAKKGYPPKNDVKPGQDNGFDKSNPDSETLIPYFAKTPLHADKPRLRTDQDSTGGSYQIGGDHDPQ